jgi:hypothetical protein
MLLDNWEGSFSNLRFHLDPQFSMDLLDNGRKLRLIALYPLLWVYTGLLYASLSSRSLSAPR